MAVVGLGLGLAGVISSAVFVDRYADAPGSADDVNARMSFTAVERFEPQGEILFVTVSGPHATALQSLMGWIDPDVRFDTYAERYGDSTPQVERTRSLARMRDAKNDAPYVAMTKLGYPTEVTPGEVLVEFVYCLEANPDGQTCKTFFPSDEFFEPGDEIVSINGTTIVTSNDISGTITGSKPGDLVEVTVRRAAPIDPSAPPTSDAPTSLEVTGNVPLSADPDDPNRSIFGIRLADTAEVKLPFAIDIDTGQIGGPSAGLAFTLTVMDELTPGELTGGKRIAVTGTMNVSGEVGPIGGLRQKAAAVKREGVAVHRAGWAKPRGPRRDPQDSR
jgi:Lon-like protease